MTFSYGSTNLRRLFEIGQSGSFLFHGSERPDIELFVPRLPKGTAFGVDGDRFVLEPLVVASSSPEVSAVVAIVRSVVGSSALAWQNMEIPSGRVSTAFSLGTGTDALDIREKLTDLSFRDDRAGSVYVFDRSVFSDGFPIVAEWFSVDPVVPVEVVHLTGEDGRELLDDISLVDTLFPISDAYIRRLSDSLVWSSGGHLQYDFSGKRLPKVVPTQDDLNCAIEHMRQRTKRFARGRWGHVERGALTPERLQRTQS